MSISIDGGATVNAITTYYIIVDLFGIDLELSCRQIGFPPKAITILQ